MDKFIATLYILPVYQAAILALLLFIYSRNRPGRARRIMGAFLTLTALYFGFNLLYSLRLFNILVNIYFLILPLILAFIPLFFLYIESLTTPGFRFRQVHGVHFLPAATVLVFNLPYLFAGGEERMAYISHGFGQTEATPMVHYLEGVYITAVYGICNIQLFYYTWRSLQLYDRHKSYIADRFSYTETISLGWIRALIFAFVAFFVINDLLFMVGMKNLAIYRLFYNLAMLAITLFAGYHGMIQNDLPSEADGRTSGQADEPTGGPEIPLKYSGSSLSDNQKQMLIGKLQKLMLEEKIYTNQKLSTDDVARRLDTNSKYISQVLNEHFRQNFFTYINGYRIRETQRLMQDDPLQKYSIMGIAELAGFSSKSTFNEAFKQVTGTTPSEYRTRARGSDS
jgi:AraC-like DNA-binding protein